MVWNLLDHGPENQDVGALCLYGPWGPDFNALATKSLQLGGIVGASLPCGGATCAIGWASECYVLPTRHPSHLRRGLSKSVEMSSIQTSESEAFFTLSCPVTLHPKAKDSQKQPACGLEATEHKDTQATTSESRNVTGLCMPPGDDKKHRDDQIRMRAYQSSLNCCIKYS